MLSCYNKLNRWSWFCCM